MSRKTSCLPVSIPLRLCSFASFARNKKTSCLPVFVTSCQKNAASISSSRALSETKNFVPSCFNPFASLLLCELCAKQKTSCLCAFVPSCFKKNFASSRHTVNPISSCIFGISTSKNPFLIKRF